MNKVLVVGSAGFIGTRLMSRGKFDVCDLKTGQDVRKGVEGDYNKVIFLAADLGQGKVSYKNNLELFYALVKTFPPDTFIVYTSSAAVYGDHMNIVNELDDAFPQTPYGRVKLLGEEIVQDYFDNYVILRLSNVVGNGDGHGVVDIFQNGGQKIYGNGEQVRDYVHVNQVVNALTEVIEKPKKYSGEIFNISSAIGQTVNEMFEIYGDGRATYLPPRKFDIEFSILDNSLAKAKGLL